ncbi:MAG: hypothetical protein WCF19_00725 [Chlamydiales bacterium]
MHEFLATPVRAALELVCRFREQYPYGPSTLFEISALEGTNVAQLKETLRIHVKDPA